MRALVLRLGWNRFSTLRLLLLVLLGALIGLGLFLLSQIERRSHNGTVPFAGIAAGLGGGPAEQGEYVFRAAGCAGCHTSKGGQFLAGGRALETPFGTFYSSNITPDPETGIGGWSEDDLVLALREGVSPDGAHYFPAFPYTSYTLMTDGDIRALKAYLETVAPVRQAAPDHELIVPLSLLPTDVVRWGMVVWKALYLDPGPYRAMAGWDEATVRGDYLVRGPGHCAECHTPRNLLGARETTLHLHGTRNGPDGKPVPAIHNHEDKGINGWAKEDITFALETGMKPDGDVMGGAMTEVVEQGTSHLSPEDLDAIAAHLMAMTPEKTE